MKIYINILLISLLYCFLTQLKAEGEKEGQGNKVYKTNGQPEYAIFNINNVSTFVKNDGETDINRNGNSGFVYPKGSNKAVFFQSGFLYGGKVDGEIRVGGSTYNQGQVPGKILENGLREDPNLDNVRIYRVRPDYKTSDFKEETGIIYGYLYNEGKFENIIGDAEELRRNYKKDWYEWPAADGAPYEDVDGNGIYNPEIDIPGIPGADQTIWFVCNDLDPNQTIQLYGSPPIGLEMQATVWGYKNIELYNDMLFRRFVLINKSGKNIENMYLTMWSDPDLGDATDDFVGCDTTLSLGYVYNGDTHDYSYGNNIPAGGFMLLQGPLVNGNPYDKGLTFDRIINGKKNLDLSSFAFFIGSDPVYSDPRLGEYQGTLHVYNLMQGRIGSTGEPFIAPAAAGGFETKYVLSGDPINKTGWIDGMNNPPGDRRFLMNSGPFVMASGDTQEVIYAQIAAGADRKIDNLSSVELLKLSAAAIKNSWNGGHIVLSPHFPKLQGSAFDKKIVLNWSLGGDSLKTIENFKSGFYEFEGYNVYQLPDINSPVSDYKLIATFDKINGIGKIIGKYFSKQTNTVVTIIAQNGNDTGLERFIPIDKDYIKNTQLHNGTPYYYVISTYTFNGNNDSFLNTFETYSNPVKIIPKTMNPGVRYNSEIDEKIQAVHIRGTSEADVDIMIVDPAQTTGHEYEISFRNTNNNLTWDLDDITDNKTILFYQENIFGTDDYIIVDGFRIIINKDETNPITENDLFRFTAPQVTYDEKLAADDVEKINVFPNPYYGYNPMETHKFGNYVIINHLPERAIIKIYNLAGHLVRKLYKDSPDQYYLWDLQNDHRIPVASGLYIIHIEMPDLGKIKLLKLAVILGIEIPDFY